MAKWLPAKFAKYVPGKKLGIVLALGVVAIGGTAIAAQSGHSRADTNRDGKVSRAESQAMASQRFAMLDVNKDGMLSPNDRAGRGPASFAQMDADKNGQISQIEFDAARMQQIDARMAEGRRDGRRGDRRGDERGGARFGGGRQAGMVRAPAMLGLADANKDGAVSQAEHLAMAQQRFDMMDSDKNGELTRAERMSARMAQRERMRAVPPAAPVSPAPPQAK